MALDLTLLLPIMAPLPMDTDLRSLQKRCLAELSGLEALVPLDSVFGGSPLHIRWVDDPANEPLLSGIWQRPPRVRDYSLLIFEIDGENCARTIASESQIPKDDPFETNLQIVSEQVSTHVFQHEINNFLLLANILYPGAISAIEGYLMVNDEPAKLAGGTSPFYAEHLFGAVTAAADLGWPKFYSIPFVDAWEWLRHSGALCDGIGIGRLGRAIAALSHLTTSSFESTSSVGLVWILLGLEALYSKGNVGLKEQLLGKTESILGPRTENKKVFGGVYDFRSRLLHGDVDIPFRYSPFDAVKKFEDFHDELMKSEDLALATLIATLQWMARNNTKEMNFVYTLEPSCRA